MPGPASWVALGQLRIDKDRVLEMGREEKERRGDGGRTTITASGGTVTVLTFGSIY